MSIEMKNPKTVLEKVDAAANLVAQMHLAHAVHDENQFRKAHERASMLLHEAVQQIQAEE